MNKAEKQVAKAQLTSEEKTLKELRAVFNQAKKDCKDRIAELNSRTDMVNAQSVIYQRKYQEAILKQIDSNLQALKSGTYTTIEDFLKDSYENGYVGMMYELQQQGIPITVPMDDRKIVRALTTDSKISRKYYNRTNPLTGRVAENVDLLKTRIRSNLSRGIAEGKSWLDVAVDLASGMNNPFEIAFRDSVRIMRTEGHRVNQQGFLDAGDDAVASGAEIVKQWDATLDDRTREAHMEADGQIVEWDEDFVVDGEKLKAPGIGGSAGNVINCRCQLLQRAKWALDEDELKTLQERAEFFGLDKSKDFEQFKQKYLNIPKPAPKKSLSELQKEHKKLKSDLESKNSQLRRYEIDYTTGYYRESKLAGYSDVSGLSENELAELRKKASLWDSIQERLEKVSNEYYDSERPDRRTQPELYALWRERNLKLQEELNSLYSQLSEIEVAREKVGRYNKYIEVVKELESKKILTKQELLDSISATKDTIAELKGKIQAIEDIPEFYDQFFKSTVRQMAESMNVEYRPIQKRTTELTEDEIIRRISGGDETEGSCASLALTYAGQKNGFDVLDFRDGNSRRLFSRKTSANEIAKFKGVSSTITTSSTPMKDAVSLLNSMVEGKEYYFSGGSHASIVRKLGGNLQYLELQSGGDIQNYGNGWHNFVNPFGTKQYASMNVKDTLKWRFSIPKTKSKYQYSTTLMDIETLQGNSEFEKLLGYINTAENAQRKSLNGTIK